MLLAENFRYLFVLKISDTDCEEQRIHRKYHIPEAMELETKKCSFTTCCLI